VLLARRRGFSRFLFFFLAIQEIGRPVEGSAAAEDGGSPAAEKLEQQTGRENQQEGWWWLAGIFCWWPEKRRWRGEERCGNGKNGGEHRLGSLYIARAREEEAGAGGLKLWPGGLREGGKREEAGVRFKKCNPAVCSLCLFFSKGKKKGERSNNAPLHWSTTKFQDS
jgi:hypothetical protein